MYISMLIVIPIFFSFVVNPTNLQVKEPLKCVWSPFLHTTKTKYYRLPYKALRMCLDSRHSYIFRTSKKGCDIVGKDSVR